MSERLSQRWMDAGDFPDDIICPYCGDLTQGASTECWEMLGPDKGHDGDRVEVECSRCEKAFQVTVWVSYAFDTQPAEKP